MMETASTYAPIVGLLFFFMVFVGIAIWAWRPSAKKNFEQLGKIPLREDNSNNG